MSEYIRLQLARMLEYTPTRRSYEAEHVIFQKVFVKLYKFENIEDLFTRVSEAFIQARLQHQNICKIFDIELHQNTTAPHEKYELLISMECLSKDLEKEIQERASSQQPYSEEELTSFLASMAQALDYSQRMKVCHRDVKPSNILIAREGYKLADFGAARTAQELSQTTTPLGTIEYMSPEALLAYTDNKAQGNYNPFLSDVYSLGVTLLSMATLKKPSISNPLFRKEEEQAVINSIQYSQRLKNMLTMMLQRNPANRTNFSQLMKMCEREKLVKLDEVVNESLMKIAKEVDEAKQATEDLESVIETLWTVLLLRKWKYSQFPSIPPPKFYCSKREVLTSFADSAETALLESVSNYEYEYLPLAYLLSPQPPQSRLTVEKYAAECQEERIFETRNYGELIQEDDDCRFAVLWRQGCVTVAEEPSTTLRLLTRIGGRVRILSGQVYRLGSATLYALLADRDCLTIRLASETSDNSFQIRGAPGCEYRIGRSSDCLIVLDTSGVSKAHAVVTWSEDRWYIEDLQSTNGTWRYCHTMQSLGRRSNEVEVTGEQEFRTSSAAYRVSLVAGSTI